jgi:hypothetical protein
MFLVLLTWLVAWPALAYFLVKRWGGRSGPGLLFSVLAVPGSLVGLYLLWLTEIEAIGWAMHRYPPPRPMFCNDFVSDERTLLPYWYGPETLSDTYGHWAWCDYGDNALVVIATGVPAELQDGFYCMSMSSGIQPGTRESVIHLRADPDKGLITLPRTRDVLVIVLPDGKMQQFPLPPGEAKRFHKARPSQLKKQNLLREATALLAPPDRASCEVFLRDYTEPPVPGH